MLIILFKYFKLKLLFNKMLARIYIILFYSSKYENIGDPIDCSCNRKWSIHVKLTIFKSTNIE